LKDKPLGACLFELWKIPIWGLENFQQKYRSVVNDLFYPCVKFHYEIPCILSSAKITKIKIWEHDQCYFQIF
jgi:hypothetical protein